MTPTPAEAPGRAAISFEWYRDFLNFLIANNVVLLPVFGHANDARAIQTLQQVFRDRRVVPINCEPLVWGMGTIHCLSQQQPRINTALKNG